MKPIGDPQALLGQLEALRRQVETASPDEVANLTAEVHALVEQLQGLVGKSSFAAGAEPSALPKEQAGGPVQARGDSSLWPGAGIEDTTAQVAHRQAAKQQDFLDSAGEVLKVADRMLLKATHPALWAGHELAQQLVPRAQAFESRALARELALLRKQKKDLEDAKKRAEGVEGDEWSHASRALMVKAALLAGSLERLQQAYQLATELEGG